MSEPVKARRTGWAEPSLWISLVGLAVSIYLTIEHFNGAKTFACPENGAVNCVKVTTSSYASFLGMPVAVLGLGYFVVALALCTPWAWAVRALDKVRLGGAVLGIVAVLYLVWAELFRIDAICLWCTVVHVCTLLLLGAIVWRTSAD